MPFPRSDRVIYRNNPLAEVICQLRFPAILKIDAEPPATFQDQIRVEYPEYRLTPVFPAELPSTALALLQGADPDSPKNVHVFASPNGTWAVSLTRTFLALKTTQYVRWEEFRVRIETLMARTVETYKPAYYSRVGLRYVDVIQRSRLNLQNRSWADLLKPHIAAEFSELDWAAYIDQSIKQISVRLSDPGGRVNIRHGLVFAEGTNEPCYIFDADFFVDGQQTETHDAAAILERFHGSAGNLFRWCIRQTLHEALDPQPAS
jgi:uncharacterized protein (TIGR04255 family)